MMTDTLQTIAIVLLGAASIYHASSIRQLSTIRAVFIKSKDAELERMLDENRILKAQLAKLDGRS